jgi:hypothetical protein
VLSVFTHYCYSLYMRRFLFYHFISNFLSVGSVGALSGDDYSEVAKSSSCDVADFFLCRLATWTCCARSTIVQLRGRNGNKTRKTIFAFNEHTKSSNKSFVDNLPLGPIQLRLLISRTKYRARWIFSDVQIASKKRVFDRSLLVRTRLCVVVVVVARVSC